MKRGETHKMRKPRKNNNHIKLEYSLRSCKSPHLRTPGTSCIIPPILGYIVFSSTSCGPVSFFCFPSLKRCLYGSLFGGVTAFYAWCHNYSCTISVKSLSFLPVGMGDFLNAIEVKCSEILRKDWSEKSV